MKRSSILRSAILLPLIVSPTAIATLLAPAARLSTCKAIVPQWRIFAGTLALMMMFGTPIHAWADDAANLEPRGEWSFNISPYVWAAGLEGTVAAVPGLPSIEVDASFKDILENLDLAAMAFVELRYGRIAGYADIIYIHEGHGGRGNACTTSLRQYRGRKHALHWHVRRGLSAAGR